MAGSTVSSRPLVPSVRDDIKIPTGEVGDLAVSIGQVKAHIISEVPATDLTNVVQYVSQTKDTTEQMTARNNIGAADNQSLLDFQEQTGQNFNQTNSNVTALGNDLTSEIDNRTQADDALQADINKRVRFDVDTQGLSGVQQTNARTNIDAEKTITTGTIAQYIRGDKSLSDFKTDVLATALSGLVFTTNAAITATDTILAAFGKLQAQVDKRLRFDASQTLTAAEQMQLRTNMGTAAGLEYFDEIATVGSSRTLKPKLRGAEATATRIDLRLLAQAAGGLILDAVASVGARSIDLQLDRVSASNSVSGAGSTAIGRGWKISGIDNTGIGQILSGLITITGQKNTVLGATGPFSTSGVATIGGDYNSILSAEIPSVSGTFNWILANTYDGITDYGKNNSLIMGALPKSQANGAVVTGNRFAQFNCRYMTNVVADMIAVSDSAVVRLRTLKNQSNPVSGTYYTLTSDSVNLVSAASTMQNGYVILTTVAHKAVFNVVIQGRITKSSGLIAHRTWQANGVYDNNESIKYSLSQIGDATNGESILDTDIEVRIVVSTGRVVVEARTQNASATGLNVSALMTVNEIILA